MKQKDIVKRKFIFIDESGDPGFSGSASSSNFFQINVLVIKDNALNFLNTEIETYKYYLNRHNELKSKVNPKDKILKKMIQKLLSHQDINFYHTRILKQNYNGPYKNDLLKFRNFLIKLLLQNIDEISKEKKYRQEIIIDRYIESQKDEYEFKKYLNNGYKLPKFIHISQVDSRYCYPIQFLDIFETFFKNNIINRKQYLINLEDQINLGKEKGPVSRKSPGT